MSFRALFFVAFSIAVTSVTAWSVPLKKGPLHPSLTVKTGSAKTVEARQLLTRDGRGVTVQSDLVVRSHLMTLEVKVPKANNLPAEIGAARLIIAMNGTRSLPIKPSVWLPKSKIWQSLATDYLPKEKLGKVIIDLPWPRLALEGDALRVMLRIEDHDPGAEPFSVLVDAVALQAVPGVSKEKSSHELAAELAGDAGPITRVHQYSGEGSGNFEAKQQSLLKNFEKKPPKPKPKPKKKKKKKKR